MLGWPSHSRPLLASFPLGRFQLRPLQTSACPSHPALLGLPPPVLSALTAAHPELRITVLGRPQTHGIAVAPWRLSWDPHHQQRPLDASRTASGGDRLWSHVSPCRTAIKGVTPSCPWCFGLCCDQQGAVTAALPGGRCGTAWDTVPLIPSSTSTFTWGLFPLRWIPDEGVDAEGCFND